MADCVETTIIGVTCGDRGQGIEDLLQQIITVISAVVVTLAVIGIIVAAVRWTTAGGNTEKAASAKKMMINIVIGLVAYACLALLASWLGIEGVTQT